MKLEIPKTIRFLPLQEYDSGNAALTGVGIHVWVDPPRSVLLEFDRLNGAYASELDRLVKQMRSQEDKPQKQTLGDRLAAWLAVISSQRKNDKFKSITESYRRAVHEWYARLWSQGPEDTAWTADELAELEEQNPAFLEWLQQSSWRLIEQHRADIKKGSGPQSGRSPAPEGPATPS